MDAYQFKRLSEKIDSLLSPALSGDQLVELGVGLIARGAYREKQRTNATQSAGLVNSAINVLVTAHLDLLQAAKEPVK